MFKLKQKTKTASLSLALAAAMTGGVMMGTSTSVQAINIAQDGIGEVLVFPYYTTRGGWQSYFNITNTSERTILVKVRWHEGVNSRDARDFIVALSPNDVWTAAVIPDPEGTGAARVVTSDKSCTAPALTHKDTDRSDALKGVDFTNLAYTGQNADGGAPSLDRTKEGYFTVFVMGVAKKENNDLYDPEHKMLTIAEAVKHSTVAGNNNEGIPKDCSVFVKEFINWSNPPSTNMLKGKRIFIEQFNADGTENLNVAGGEFHEPNNVLKGRAILINPANGIAMGYDPTVMANFYNPTEFGQFKGKDSDNPKNTINKPDNTLPNLSGASPAEASWIDDTPGASAQLQTVSASQATASYGIGFGRPIDAVSVLFQRAAIVNDYNVAGDSKTDWVVTLPTKRYYVDNASNTDQAGLPGESAPVAPFDRASVNGEAFNENLNGRSCFDVTMRLWDREEGELTAPGGLNFSPAPPPGQANQFCYETNVISFGKAMNTFSDELTGETLPLSNVMGSQLSKSFDKLAGDYGWAQLEFGRNGGESLPVIGLRLETRKQAGNPAASYGFANAHSYKRDIRAYMEAPAWEIEPDREEPQY